MKGYIVTKIEEEAGEQSQFDIIGVFSKPELAQQSLKDEVAKSYELLKQDYDDTTEPDVSNGWAFFSSDEGCVQVSFNIEEKTIDEI